jgi:hypothetical protein
MKRSVCISLVVFAAASLSVTTTLAQTDAAKARRDKIEKLKQQRDAARQAGKDAQAARQTPPPATTTPPPPPPPATTTAAPPPPPPATTTAAPPKPPASASASATASAAVPSASAAPSAAPVTSSSVAPSASALPLALDLDALRKSRADRRRLDVQRLKDRWGELTSDERAKSELKLHARRSAYLQRIRALAERANDTKLVESVDKLITKEERRDADAMNAIRTGVARVASPVPAAAGASK